MAHEEGVDLEFVEAIASAFRRMRRYCRLEVEGLDRLPEGPFVVVANHTGWIGLDFANLFLVLYDDAHRLPRAATHPTFFRLPAVRPWAERLGFYEASVGRSLGILDEGRRSPRVEGRAGGVVCFFPEGEEGNFKPIRNRYRLEAFKPGFARVALAARVPVVPVAIVGGEEANPSLARIDRWKETLGLALPVPLNVVPFPIKWRMSFMEPVDPDEFLAKADPDEDAPARLAAEIRDRLQGEVLRQVEKRGNPLV